MGQSRDLEWDCLRIRSEDAGGFGQREAPRFGVKVIEGRVGVWLRFGVSAMSAPEMGPEVRAGTGEPQEQFGVMLGLVRVSTLGLGILRAW